VAKETKPRASAKGRPKNFAYRFQPRDKSFSLTLQFRRAHVSREEIAKTLADVASELRRG
jgi:hypothetical protein